MSEFFNDYDSYLIGKKKGISSFHFFGDSTGGANEKKALSCIQYTIEYLLKWNITDAMTKFDRNVIEQMKLGRLVSYIEFPVYIFYGDPLYILSLIYPEKIRIQPHKAVERIFEDVIENGTQFPREFFTGEAGFERYVICFRYLIAKYKVFHSLKEIYDYFSSTEGRSFLSEFRLKSPAFQFGIDILDVIYDMTKKEENSYLYYCFFKFRQGQKAQNR